jgi:hypothetical protein
MEHRYYRLVSSTSVLKWSFNKTLHVDKGSSFLFVENDWLTPTTLKYQLVSSPNIGVSPKGAESPS